MKRKATAEWTGHGKDGSGRLTSTSGVLGDTPYSFKGRFESEDGRAGTNPEELIAAAHAGCFSMALAIQLANAGHPSDSIRTEATITLEKSDGGWSIARSDLAVEADVPGIDEAQFRELAEKAKAGCPVSRALNVEIGLTTATLASS